MKRAVWAGQSHDFFRSLDVDYGNGGGGKKRQLVDRLRRTGAAQPAGTVCRHRDKTTPAVRCFEHGGQQLGSRRARSGDNRDRPPVARLSTERKKSCTAFFEK